MESPKGKMRLVWWGLAGVLLIVIATMFDPLQQAMGWVVTTVLGLGKGVLAASMYYWLLRTFLHTRTHEVENEQDRLLWQMVMMVSVAIVFGMALIQ